jgi:hypothetical protein
MEWPQATQRDDDNRIGAPSMLRFPYAAYNMVVTACHLGDISDTPDRLKDQRKASGDKTTFFTSPSSSMRSAWRIVATTLP